MIRVPEKDLHSELVQVARIQCFYRALGAYGSKCGRIDRSMGCHHPAQPRSAIAGTVQKRELEGHGRIVACRPEYCQEQGVHSRPTMPFALLVASEYNAFRH